MGRTSATLDLSSHQKNKTRLIKYVHKNSYDQNSPAFGWKVGRDTFLDDQVYQVDFTPAGDWRKAIIYPNGDGYELCVWDLRGNATQPATIYKSFQTALKNGSKAVGTA